MLLQITEAGYYLIGATLIFILFFLIFFLFYRNVMQKRNEMFLNEEKIKADFSQTLLQSQLEIQEQTLKNISQEIHDNIGQALTLAKLNLNTMPDAREAQQEKIITTKDIISKAIGDLRDLSRSLNTDYIADMGLQKAIEYELDLISKSGTIKATLKKEGISFRTDKQKDLILFRIVQETLNNIIKHADAKTIHANLTYQDDKLVLSITDDGKGFEMSAKESDNENGLGLRNMHNRAKLIGAVFSISSLPGKGTEVKVILPKTTEKNGISAER